MVWTIGLSALAAAVGSSIPTRTRLMIQISRLISGATPLLVAAAVAGPQDDEGAVGGAGAVGVQALPGLRTGDAAVVLEVPPGAGPAGAVPDHGAALPVRVEALGAV